MMVVLTGGTGGAKFVDALKQLLPARKLALIVNTGDDLEWWGLHVSPDLDSIMYVLAGMLSKDRGWGVDGDTFECVEAVRRMGAPAWFRVGDRDLATHLTRSQLLASGRTLSEATAEIAAALEVQSRILPMSDARVETRVTTPEGELSFQEYFVRERYRPEVRGVRFVGAEQASPAPGVLEAIQSAEAVVLAPSNPITSIGPILAVPGIREALKKTAAPVAAVSPIVGGAAVSGPAGALMASQGLPVSVAGVAQAYSDFLDLLIVDERDAKAAEQLRLSGLQVHCAQTIMKTTDDKAALAATVLQLVTRSAARAG
ncbi:MAG TPA: 2-phospho-L-lactate transferase [Terriglobales bacterium]|nr:2-phospho-L-lactate transferase [Terriglobales bacterium]